MFVCSLLSGRAVSAFLQGPAVAVRVGEVGEAGVVATLRIQPRAPPAGPGPDRLLVPDLADGDTASDELRPLRREVGRDEMQVMVP
jgi:hypothetical protein